VNDIVCFVFLLLYCAVILIVLSHRDARAWHYVSRKQLCIVHNALLFAFYLRGVGSDIGIQEKRMMWIAARHLMVSPVYLSNRGVNCKGCYINVQ
jgi:hypothetical protein